MLLSFIKIKFLKNFSLTSLVETKSFQTRKNLDSPQVIKTRENLTMKKIRSETILDYLPLFKLVYKTASLTHGNHIYFDKGRNEFVPTTKRGKGVTGLRRIVLWMVTLWLTLQTCRLLDVTRSKGFLSSIPSILMSVGFIGSFFLAVMGYRHARNIANLLNTLIRYQKYLDAGETAREEVVAKDKKYLAGNGT